MIIIAIDGPAASGKGTIAHKFATYFGFSYLDTGLLYREVGRRTKQADGFRPDGSVNQAIALQQAKELATNIIDASLTLDNPDLRGIEAGKMASQVAALDDIRVALVTLQQSFAHNPPPPVGVQKAKGVVLDGRDIGTVICPEAQIKLFIDARPEERANRRYQELLIRNIACTYEDILQDLRERDHRDQNRSTAPLKVANNADVLDTTMLDIDQSFQEALALVYKRYPALKDCVMVT